MPKNVMKLLKPSPHRGRNDFDLSHRHVFDANFGELLPATCIETVPGDNITLHASDLIRAIPLVTSPFLRAKQHLDVWYVPYRDLWHNFNNFMTQKDDPASAALGGFTYCPHTTLYDLYQAHSYGNSQNHTDVVGRPLADRDRLLLQLLGYTNLYSTSQSSQSTSLSTNLWRLAAYNYIWYNEYRQSYYDDGKRLGGSNLNVAKLWNFDDLTCNSQANSYLNYTNYSNRLEAMIQMRYRTWKKDLYTGLLPSTQFGAVSTVTNGNNGIVSFIQPSNISTNASGAYISKDSAGFVQLRQGSTGSDSGLKVQPIDVLALRKSEALQIWRENSLRAGNRVSDNMRAHYGVESDFKDHRPVYLGSVSAPLNIGDVMTTANSSTGINTTVGDIAGKGTSSLDEKVFKFHAKDFGVIMVIFSMLPEAEYEADGIERTNQLLEMEDYFVPEYENLGLEGVSASNFVSRTAANNSVIGYAPRYYGYKTKLDKCFGLFVGNGIFRPWTSQKTDISTAIAQSGGGALPISTLYVNPANYDPNFSVGLSNSSQFLVDLYFDIDAIRPMSVTGLPFS